MLGSSGRQLVCAAVMVPTSKGFDDRECLPVVQDRGRPAAGLDQGWEECKERHPRRQRRGRLGLMG